MNNFINQVLKKSKLHKLQFLSNTERVKTVYTTMATKDIFNPWPISKTYTTTSTTTTSTTTTSTSTTKYLNTTSSNPTDFPNDIKPYDDLSTNSTPNITSLANHTFSPSLTNLTYQEPILVICTSYPGYTHRDKPDQGYNNFVEKT